MMLFSGCIPLDKNNTQPKEISAAKISAIKSKKFELWSGFLLAYRFQDTIHDIDRQIINDPLANIYINDNNRIKEKIWLTVLERPKDLKTFKCFWKCDRPVTWQPGQDKKYVFPEPWFNDNNTYLAIPKNEIPNFQPIDTYGTQSFDGILGYSPGKFIIIPFWFPVDKDSFQLFKPKKHQSSSFINNGKRYRGYIAKDKNRIYMMRKDQTGLARLPIARDFKVLNQNEEAKIITKDSSLELQKIQKLPPKDQLFTFREDEVRGGTYKDATHYYFTDEKNNYRSIKVDGTTLKSEYIHFPHPRSWDFSILHDKDAYYQFIYHEEGRYTEIKKIKKAE